MTSRHVHLYLRKVHDDSHGASHGVCYCGRLMSSLTMQFFVRQMVKTMPLIFDRHF